MSLDELTKNLTENNTNANKRFRTIPCKFYLNDCCKNGSNCEFLHEKTNESKIAECPFAICYRQDCKYRHTDKEVPECPYYRNGYCKEGGNCKFKHVKRELCINYLIGFCPEGPDCKNFHLKSLVNKNQLNPDYLKK